MKNISRKKLLILIAIFVITVLVIFFILLNDEDAQKGVGKGFEDEVGSEEYIIEEPDRPKEKWERKIDIEAGDGTKTFTNVYDGYSIIVPNKWSASEEVRTGSQGLTFSQGQSAKSLQELEDRLISHIDEGVYFNIIVEPNPNNLSLADWLGSLDLQKSIFKNANFQRIQHPLYQLYKTQKPLTHDEPVGNQIVEVPIDDTLSVQYLIKSPKINTIYIINCTIHNDVELYAPQCDNLIKNFVILER